MSDGPEGIRLYTRDEAAEILNCRTSWLRDQVSAGRVPHVRLGKVKGVRFTASDLREIVAARCRAASSTPPLELPGNEADPFAGLRSIRAVHRMTATTEE